MFSRVILGMHTFNEVLLGACIGLFSIVLYYLYVESLMIKMVATLLDCPQQFNYTRSMEEKSRRRMVGIVLIWTFILTSFIDFLVVYLPSYNYEDYWAFITTISGCENMLLVRSFQYRSLQDLTILQGGLGIALGMFLMKDPSSLVKVLAYSRCSCRFIGRLVLMLLVAAIPLAVFLLPVWQKLDLEIEWLAALLWVFSSLGFFLALFILVYLSPIVCAKCGLEEYGECTYLLPPE